MRVIVVGGGVLGASAAFHLAGLGAETRLVARAALGLPADLAPYALR
ncbi:NAD-binding protein [Rhodovarius lipocyclicus]|nr:NAD-binding protein [Rhodovarius lipocyclicus]